ncbi:MAG: hypothetical protein KGP28_11895 [Bdellovibrionales bacterium]|nr:hypothetical protein [Bdellovibrionales bacterium]
MASHAGSVDFDRNFEFGVHDDSARLQFRPVREERGSFPEATRFSCESSRILIDDPWFCGFCALKKRAAKTLPDQIEFDLFLDNPRITVGESGRLPL